MNGILSDIVIVAILAVAVFFGIRNMIRHAKGEGDCCGGGSGVRLMKPKKLEKVIATKTIYIEGMFCDNCSGRVHNALNSIDGVNAKVLRSKGRATVKLGKEVSDETLKKAITDLGYTVNGVEKCDHL